MDMYTKVVLAKRAFEQKMLDTNQGYDFTPCSSGKMSSYEDERTEHAWRGWCKAIVSTDLPSGFLVECHDGGEDMLITPGYQEHRGEDFRRQGYTVTPLYRAGPPLPANNLKHHRRVVCSANRNVKTGEIILGIRHWDDHMTEHNKLIKERGALGRVLKIFIKKPSYKQGFIDQFGVWMDRQEAWKVALEAGQILYRCGGDDSKGGTLYSENLY